LARVFIIYWFGVFSLFIPLNTKGFDEFYRRVCLSEENNLDYFEKKLKEFLMVP